MTTKAILLAIDTLLAVQSESMSPAVRVQVEKAIQALMDEDAQQAESLYLAAINCRHEIKRESITLHFDVTQEGHNALDQLFKRLEKALKATP